LIFFKIVVTDLFSKYYINSVGGQSASLDKLLLFLFISGVAILIYYSILLKDVKEKTFGFHLVSSLLGLYMITQFMLFIYLIITLAFVEDS